MTLMCNCSQPIVCLSEYLFIVSFLQFFDYFEHNYEVKEGDRSQVTTENDLYATAASCLSGASVLQLRKVPVTQIPAPYLFLRNVMRANIEDPVNQTF
jgi:hypothetical protein